MCRRRRLLLLLLLLPSTQVLRRLAETGGDYEAAAAMADFQSGKPALAKAINVAKAKQDEATASALCKQLDAMSLLSYNPFDPDAALPEGTWSVEMWYYENRKRVYNILA